MRGTLIAFVSLISLAALTPAPKPVRLTSPTSYFIEEGKGIAGYDAADRELAEIALAAWARESGGHVKFVRATEPASALLRIRWISPDEGVYGETERLMVKGRPGGIVNIAPAIAGLGEPLATLTKQDRLLRDSIVYLTCVHEIGHVIGLPHTRKFEDIMYSFTYGGDIVEYFSRYRRSLGSRADIATVSGLSDNDRAALKSLY